MARLNILQLILSQFSIRRIHSFSDCANEFHSVRRLCKFRLAISIGAAFPGRSHKLFFCERGQTGNKGMAGMAKASSAWYQWVPGFFAFALLKLRSIFRDKT